MFGSYFSFAGVGIKGSEAGLKPARANCRASAKSCGSNHFCDGMASVKPSLAESGGFNIELSFQLLFGGFGTLAHLFHLLLRARIHSSGFLFSIALAALSSFFGRDRRPEGKGRFESVFRSGPAPPSPVEFSVEVRVRHWLPEPAAPVPRWQYHANGGGLNGTGASLIARRLLACQLSEH